VKDNDSDGCKRFLYHEMKTLKDKAKNKKNADHSESNVSFLERRSIVRSISSDGDNFTVRVEATVNDALDQRVLVLG